MLTNHQKTILYKSIDILHFSNRLLIKGSAGTGKTYLVNALLKQIGSNKHILCTAPTNKALSVLKNKVDVAHNIEFATTHSALKLKRFINYNDGTVSFKPSYSDKNLPLKGINILVVDEASMVNSEMLSYIEEHSKIQDTKVIFLGDSKQLNPVGEEESPVFIVNYPTVELTEIVRQGLGNPIIEMSRNLSLIYSKKDNRISEGGYIYSNDREKVIETLASVNGTDDLKYLAWTNKEVDTINSLVRKRIYGVPKKVELGESIILNAPYNENFTNEEITIKTLDVVEKNFNYFNKEGSKITDPESEDAIIRFIKLKHYIVNGYMLIIHEDSEKDFDELKKKLKAKAKLAEISWKDYYEFVEQFADFKYNHAITVHKS